MVGPYQLPDLKHLVGERDRDEVYEHVAEKRDVRHQDDDGERHYREEQHLVVGEAEAEDESREEEDLIGGFAHPSVGKQKDPHQK